MTKAEIREGALRLPPEDRIRMVEVLWESLEPDTISVPGWHEQVLDQRAAAADAHPGRFSSWEEAKGRIRQRLRGPSKG